MQGIHCGSRGREGADETEKHWYFDDTGSIMENMPKKQYTQ